MADTAVRAGIDVNEYVGSAASAVLAALQADGDNEELGGSISVDNVVVAEAMFNDAGEIVATPAPGAGTLDAPGPEHILGGEEDEWDVQIAGASESGQSMHEH